MFGSAYCNIEKVSHWEGPKSRNSVHLKLRAFHVNKYYIFARNVLLYTHKCVQRRYILLLYIYT